MDKQTQIEYTQFTLEEEIIHHLMLQTATLKRNGLLYGKLGIAITFFECGRYWNNPIFTDYAEELTDCLPKKLDNKITRDFATGLCGYGWGFEYLIQRKFIDAGNKICTDIDEKVMAIDIRRMNDLSLETGLEGFLHYILVRLKGTSKRKETIPFDKTYLKDTYNRLQSLPEENTPDNLYHLKQKFTYYLNTDSLTYKPDISLFTNNQEVKSEEDILNAKLGLNDGLAGKLIRMMNQKNRQS